MGEGAGQSHRGEGNHSTCIPHAASALEKPAWPPARELQRGRPGRRSPCTCIVPTRHSYVPQSPSINLQWRLQ